MPNPNGSIPNSLAHNKCNVGARRKRSGRLAAFVSRRRGNAKSYRVVSACTRAHGIICVCWLALKSHVVARSLSRSLSLSLSPSVPGSLARSALPTVMLGMEPGVAPTRRCHGTGRAARATAAFTTACCPTPMHTSEPGGRGVGSCSIAGARLSAGVPEARGPMRRSTCAEGGRSRTRARSFSLSRSLARSLAPSLSLPLSICAAGQVRMAASQIVLC